MENTQEIEEWQTNYFVECYWNHLQECKQNGQRPMPVDFYQIGGASNDQLLDALKIRCQLPHGKLRKEMNAIVHSVDNKQKYPNIYTRKVEQFDEEAQKQIEAAYHLLFGKYK